MVISCPACSKKFNFNGEAKNHARFRCTACGSVFGIGGQTAAKAAAARETFKVVAATENKDIARAVKAALADDRVVLSLADDGNQALEKISKDKPHLLILDAAIQGMFSFTLCEKIKSDQALKDIKIILTSAAFNKGRYKRRPSELFGADCYIEAHQLEDILAGKAGALLGAELGGSVAEAGGPACKARENAGPEDGTEGKDARKTDEDSKAKRLARVIAADILLYHRKKLSQKVEKQDASVLFKEEIEEAVKYFNKRLPGADTAYIHTAIEECLDSMNKDMATEAANC
jgi:CheY-like chemotaxis protein